MVLGKPNGIGNTGWQFDDRSDHFDPLQKIKIARITLEIASMMLGIFSAYQFGINVVTIMRYNYFPEDRPYMEVLPFLEENTRPEVSSA